MTIREATSLVGQSQGLGDDFDGGPVAVNSLDPSQKLALTAAVLAYIRDNPSQFTAAQVATANSDTARQQDFSRGITPTVTLADIGGAVADSVNDVLVKPLASVGNGVSSLVNIVGKIIPIVGLGVVLYLAYAWTRRAAPSS